MSIETRAFTIGSNEVVFLAPHWASGFDCQGSNCGYCCVTEVPYDQVSIKKHPKYKMNICTYYDVQYRKCQNYPGRPFTCKLFPLIMCADKKQILTSAMLGCPATNDSTFNNRMLDNILNDDEVIKRIRFTSDIYYASSNTSSMKIAIRYYDIIKRELRQFFHKDISFPLLKDVVRPLFRNEVRNISLPNLRNMLAYDIQKTSAYIATRFDSTDLLYISLQGNTVRMTNLKDKKWKFQFKACNLTVSKKASDIFRDYLELIFSRNLLNLAAISYYYKGIPIHVMLRDYLFSFFVYLDVGSSLIGVRDKLDELDDNIIREVISYIEPNVLTLFNRPDFKGKQL